MFKSWKRNGRRSFTAKIMALFITTVILPLLIVYSIFYFISNYAMQNKTEDYLKNLASVTISKVEDSIEDVELIGFYIAGNDEVIETLNEENDPDQTRGEHYKRYSATRTLLFNYSMLKPAIESVYIQSHGDMEYGYSKRRIYVDYDKLFDKTGDVESSWVMYEKRIYLVRQINTYLKSQKLGDMAIETDPSAFYDIIDDIDYSGSGEVYLIDKNNTIIAGKKSDMTGEKLSSEYDGLSLKADTLEYNVEINGRKCIVYTGDSICNGWRLVLSIPTDYYMSDVNYLRNQMIVVLVLVGIIAIVLIILVSEHVTKPVKELSMAMEEVGKGNMDVVCETDSDDEIGRLGNTFNHMLCDMKILIDREYEQKVRTQGAEMKSLQMQINPHFLYNTLDTINWMARIQGVDDIGNMTSALGSLMRYSLSKKEFVMIKDEVDNLKCYVEIQNVRYGDKMTVDFNVDSELENCYIPKLLIQPILENAIVHGVEDKIEASKIEVSIYHEGDDMFAVVNDDGVGMTQEAIEAILSDDVKEKKGHTSIGVNNVNQRIKMTYGPNYGLMIQSELGAGTKITLRMSVMDVPPESILNK